MTIECYNCKVKQADGESEQFPFCSEECHKLWADEHYSPMKKISRIQSNFDKFLEQRKGL